jgi:transglutaminase-like putative cysteine protease
LTVSAGLAVGSLPKFLGSARADDPTKWRTFEVTTIVEVKDPVGGVRTWVPVPLNAPTDYFKREPDATSGNFKRGSVVQYDKYGTAIAFAEWAPTEKAPAFEVKSRFMTRDRQVDLSAKPNPAIKEDPAVLRYFRQPSKYIRTDGLVATTAKGLTQGYKSDLDKARAIYEWIVENTFRDPKVKGCGIGDITTMLESGYLGGKCADLNALYVGLARASGIPARDVYGVRVAASSEFKSLGRADDITGAQHCRADVFLNGYGWVPVDPADVRKVVLEEPPGNRPLDDEMVKKARARLFGSWELNWMAYNFGHDVALPGSTGAPVGFLMYPQAETADGRLDCLDPDNFKYEISSRELTQTKA